MQKMETVIVKHAGGRPTIYGQSILDKAEAYLITCEDELGEFHKTRGINSDSYERTRRVRLPTIEGLALALDINKTTIFEWDKKYPEFSNLINRLRDKQADALINNGLSGEYNPMIAKVLLTKHGYREEQGIVGKDGGAINILFDTSFLNNGSSTTTREAETNSLIEGEV